MNEKGAKEIPSDQENLGIFLNEFREWLDTDWFPGATGFGLQRIGSLLSSCIPAEMSPDKILTKVFRQF